MHNWRVFLNPVIFKTSNSKVTKHYIPQQNNMIIAVESIRGINKLYIMQTLYIMIMINIVVFDYDYDCKCACTVVSQVAIG